MHRLTLIIVLILNCQHFFTHGQKNPEILDLKFFNSELEETYLPAVAAQMTVVCSVPENADVKLYSFKGSPAPLASPSVVKQGVFNVSLTAKDVGEVLRCCVANDANKCSSAEVYVPFVACQATDTSTCYNSSCKYGEFCAFVQDPQKSGNVVKDTCYSMSNETCFLRSSAQTATYANTQAFFCPAEVSTACVKPSNLDENAWAVYYKPVTKKATCDSSSSVSRFDRNGQGLRMEQMLYVTEYNMQAITYVCPPVIANSEASCDIKANGLGLVKSVKKACDGSNIYFHVPDFVFNETRMGSIVCKTMVNGEVAAYSKIYLLFRSMKTALVATMKRQTLLATFDDLQCRLNESLPANFQLTSIRWFKESTPIYPSPDFLEEGYYRCEADIESHSCHPYHRQKQVISSKSYHFALPKTATQGGGGVIVPTTASVAEAPADHVTAHAPATLEPSIVKVPTSKPTTEQPDGYDDHPESDSGNETEPTRAPSGPVGPSPTEIVDVKFFINDSEQIYVPTDNSTMVIVCSKPPGEDVQLHPVDSHHGPAVSKETAVFNVRLSSKHAGASFRCCMIKDSSRCSNNEVHIPFVSCRSDDTCTKRCKVGEYCAFVPPRGSNPPTKRNCYSPARNVCYLRNYYTLTPPDNAQHIFCPADQSISCALPAAMDAWAIYNKTVTNTCPDTGSTSRFDRDGQAVRMEDLLYVTEYNIQAITYVCPSVIANSSARCDIKANGLATMKSIPKPCDGYMYLPVPNFVFNETRKGSIECMKTALVAGINPSAALPRSGDLTCKLNDTLPSSFRLSSVQWFKNVEPIYDSSSLLGRGAYRCTANILYNGCRPVRQSSQTISSKSYSLETLLTQGKPTKNHSEGGSGTDGQGSAEASAGFPGWAIGLIVAAIVLLVVAVGIYVFCRHRKSHGSTSSKSRTSLKTSYNVTGEHPNETVLTLDEAHGSAVYRRPGDQVPMTVFDTDTRMPGKQVSAMSSREPFLK